MQRHEVPTHLNIEDKAFAGLTMRQLMVAIIGLAIAYSAMSEAPLPLTLRLGAGATVLLVTAAVSFWQPAGRSIEDWTFVLLRYVTIPRVVVWRVRESLEDTSSDEERFEVVLPDRLATDLHRERRSDR
ncbi:MAG: PrgI family protein [Dehalococcoidia bacterium]|nr:PrgI family protein [Dehalococcoidia bacterium]